MMMRILTLSFAVAAAQAYATDVDGTGQDSKNDGRTPLVTRLLELGADPNAAERTQGMTALISLTAHVDDDDTFLDIAKLLFRAGADCDRATIPHGGTPAIYAVLDRKYTALAALGVSGRCDMDKADAGGKTPADWARRSNDEQALSILTHAKPEL